MTRNDMELQSYRQLDHHQSVKMCGHILKRQLHKELTENFAVSLVLIRTLTNFLFIVIKVNLVNTNSINVFIFQKTLIPLFFL